MTDIRPIWTPDDFDRAVADAKAVVDSGHRRLSVVADTERALAVEPSRMFTRSRYRRAKIMDAIAVALLMAFMAALGVIVFASTAKADDSQDAEAYAYAAHYGSAVCAVLDDYTSVSGVLGVMDGITQDGLTPYQAGQVVGISVTELCPQHGWLLDLFIDRYGSSSAA